MSKQPKSVRKIKYECVSVNFYDGETVEISQ